jgi:hypothetical protein
VAACNVMGYGPITTRGSVPHTIAAILPRKTHQGYIR